MRQRYSSTSSPYIQQQDDENASGHYQHVVDEPTEQIAQATNENDDTGINQQDNHDHHPTTLKGKYQYQKARFLKFKNNLYVKRTTSVLLFWFKLLSGPILALPFFCGAMSGWGSTVDIDRCAGVTAWMACYWIFQPVPLPVTGLLPLILFPLLGTTSGKGMAAAWFNDTSFLYVGSFIMAAAIEKWNIHKRFALFVLRFIGIRPRLILFGFTCLVGFITMWISNTATTAMFLPLANAVITSIRNRNEENPNKEEREREEVKIKKFAKALFMAIPFASSIMGTSTLIGTPTNLVIGQVLNSNYKKLATTTNNPISFLNWFIYAFPPMIILLIVTFLYLLIVLVRNINIKKEDDSVTANVMELGETNLSERLIDNQDMELSSEYYITANGMENSQTETIPTLDSNNNNRKESLTDNDHCQLTSTSKTKKQKKKKSTLPNIFKKEYKKLGKIKIEEIIISLLFFILCLLWFLRDLSFGSVRIAWTYLVFFISGKPVKKQDTIMSYPNDGTAAIVVSILLFFIPSFNKADEPLVDSNEAQYDTSSRLQRWKAKIFKWRNPTGRIIEWKEAQSKLPWDILMLLGGGYALAQAFSDCGFSEFIVNVLVVKLDLANKVAPFSLVFIIVFGICMLTQLTTNTSIAVLSMPVLAVLGPKLGQNPVFFMAPATLACSMAFMTPIGTSPNMLAFAYGQFSILDGLLHGGVINLVSLAAIELFAMAMFPAIGVQENVMPDWAIATNSTIKAIPMF